MRKILVLHGWMHSSERYKQFKKVLEENHNFKVDLYEFSGFDKQSTKYKKHILQNYAKELSEYLDNHNYDCVIAHSMGGNVALRALCMLNKPVHTVILLNPEYGGIPFLKPFIVLFPLILASMYLIKIKCIFTDLIIKIISLFTVNKWTSIDHIILDDARKANPWVATVLMFELAYDKWRSKSSNMLFQNMYLLSSENDRIIKPGSAIKLMQDIPECKQKIIPNIGHTTVLEAFSELVHEVLKICDIS